MKWNMLLCLAILFVWTESGMPQETSTNTRKCEIVAHRGFSWKAPENTLASIREAIASGAQGCEIDLRRSTDGVIYLFHDNTTKRYDKTNRKVTELSWSELQKLDTSVIHHKFANYSGEKIPSLDAALHLLKNSSCRPIIEVKESGFEKDLIEAIRKYGLEKRATIIDFSMERVKKYRAIAPEISVAWLCSWNQEKYTPADIQKMTIERANLLNVNIIDMDYSNMTPDLCSALHALGIQVWVWTVDQPNDIKRLRDMGVDSITTNRPDLAFPK